MDNILEVFKEQLPTNKPYAGQGKIFLNRVCTGRSYSYSVERINRFFEENDNADHILQRLISMMEYLQDGYHKGVYGGLASAYAHATTEYPEKYLLLVNGLSEKALDVIRRTKMSDWTTAEPDNLGEVFYTSIMRDRSTANKIEAPAFKNLKVA